MIERRANGGPELLRPIEVCITSAAAAGRVIDARQRFEERAAAPVPLVSAAMAAGKAQFVRRLLEEPGDIVVDGEGS